MLLSPRDQNPSSLVCDRDHRWLTLFLSFGSLFRERQIAQYHTQLGYRPDPTNPSVHHSAPTAVAFDTRSELLWVGKDQVHNIRLSPVGGCTLFRTPAWLFFPTGLRLLLTSHITGSRCGLCLLPKQWNHGVPAPHRLLVAPATTGARSPVSLQRDGCN